jgi:hypothetical protein
LLPVEEVNGCPVIVALHVSYHIVTVHVVVAVERVGKALEHGAPL